MLKTVSNPITTTEFLYLFFPQFHSKLTSLYLSKQSCIFILKSFELPWHVVILWPRSKPILKLSSTSFRFFEEVEVNLRPAVSRPVCLGVRHPSGTFDRFFFLLEISFRHLRVWYFVAPSLTRGRVCNLLYNCFWALPEQSLLCRSPAELTAIFYCLIWLPQPGVPGSRIYIPQEQGGPVKPPGIGLFRFLHFKGTICTFWHRRIAT
jgi:hypothetical protein